MRVLFLADHHHHPLHHRKVELLADAPDVEILSINTPDCGRSPGVYPSANGQRSYTLHTLPQRSLGHPGDPHRTFFWPPPFEMGSFQPDLIHCELEQEGIGAAQVALLRGLLAPRSRLCLHSYQNILRRRRWPVRLVGWFTRHSAQYICCDSREAADVLRRQGYQGAWSVFAQVGVDTRCFFPKPVLGLHARLGLRDDRPVVAYVGRLVAEKGIDTLLYAAAAARSSPQVVLVGSGPQQAGLEALARQLGILDRCCFIGPVVYDTISDYLNLLDVFVLPSRTTRDWKEQFGRVLVEAMACKVPVVGSDSGSIPEVVGDAGLIFPEGDARALAAAIDDLAACEDLRRTLSERGYQRVMDHYTVERAAESLLKVWREL
jgi:glycosyltransferase involved in cell wall biosynthesis